MHILLFLCYYLSTLFIAFYCMIEMVNPFSKNDPVLLLFIMMFSVISPIIYVLLNGKKNDHKQVDSICINDQKES